MRSVGESSPSWKRKSQSHHAPLQTLKKKAKLYTWAHEVERDHLRLYLDSLSYMV